MRILLVDDEVTLLRAFGRALGRSSLVTEAHCAAAAKEALAAATFDVVVTDYNMPGVDGIALLTFVAEFYPATRRILISGRRPPTSPVVEAFLEKPRGADALLKAIAALPPRGV